MFYFILLVVFIWIAWSFIKAKARMHEVNKWRAEKDFASGTTQMPSWATNKNRMQEFVAMIRSGARRRGIPQKFVQGCLTNKYGVQRLLSIAGSMEKNGASFEGQSIAVFNKIEEYWANATAEEKNDFLE